MNIKQQHTTARHSSTQSRYLNRGLALSLLLSIMLLSGCSNLNSKLSTLQTANFGGVSTSERKKLEADGWVFNEPGKPHTHRVNLPDCPEIEYITHTHEGEQANTGWHKHNGCFTCPPKAAGVQRIR